MLRRFCFVDVAQFCSPEGQVLRMAPHPEQDPLQDGPGPEEHHRRRTLSDMQRRGGESDHIISGCPVVQSFWNTVGWQPGWIAPVTELWNMQLLPTVSKAVLHPLLLLFCWEIWKHHNEVVFRQTTPSIGRLKAACIDSGSLWSHRITKKNENLAKQWRQACLM